MPETMNLKPIALRIPHEVYDAVARQAETERRTWSAMARLLLERQLELMAKTKSRPLLRSRRVS